MRPRVSRAQKLERGRVRNRRYIAGLSGRVAVLFGDYCQECGSTASLEFAHLGRTKLKGRGRGQIRRLLDVLRNPGLYKRLCRPCHMDLDYAGRDPWTKAPPDTNQLELEAVPF